MKQILDDFVSLRCFGPKLRRKMCKISSVITGNPSIMWVMEDCVAELKYKSLYGDQEFDIYLIKFVQCMCNLPIKDSWALNGVICSHSGESFERLLRPLNFKLICPFANENILVWSPAPPLPWYFLRYSLLVYTHSVILVFQAIWLVRYLWLMSIIHPLPSE